MPWFSRPIKAKSLRRGEIDLTNTVTVEEDR